MATAATELKTIRALSQYRPFEGGGASVHEAHDDLLLGAFAEAGGSIASIGEAASAIEAFFTVELGEVVVAEALGRLLKEGRVERAASGFALTQAEAERMGAVSAESQAIADEALAEWRTVVLQRFPLAAPYLDRLQGDLGLFLKGIMRRHGAEAGLLLYPESEAAQDLYAQIEQEGLDLLGEAEHQEIRDFALYQFIRHPTPAQKAYLAQNLNTSYFLTVLSIDPDGARLVTELIAGQRVYLDTNFIYRLLGVQGPRYVKPAEAILRATQKAGYDCVVTDWTLDEFRGSLRRARSFIERYPMLPSQYALVAAEATSQENFVTAYWREVRGGLKPQDFFAFYDEIEMHLQKLGVGVSTEGCKAVDAQTDLITDEISTLARVSYGRFRHPEVLEHDVKHRLLVKRLRGEGRRGFANAGYWFLTHDSVLPRYNYLATRDRNELAFCVSAGTWFQVMEAFTPKTQDPDQSLADMLASPYIKYRRELSLKTTLQIVSRVNQFKDGTPELATKVLMNSAAVEEIEASASDEEEVVRIDSAIIAAAKETQEEARQATLASEQERQKAEKAAKEAQARAAEAEERASRAVAAADAARQDQVARAEARGAEAVKREEERTERIRQDLGARHRQEVEARESQLAAARADARKARRRLLFFFAALVCIALFLLLDLAFGLRSGWSALAAAGVLIGLGLGISQWARWHSGEN
jgi:hypothetical protein